MAQCRDLPPRSPLHEVFDAVEVQRQSAKVLGLHVGEPEYAPPPVVHEAIIRALHDGNTGYCGAMGLPILRQALAEKVNVLNNLKSDPNCILVSPGSTQGLFAIFTLLSLTGRESILPEVYWPIHLQQVVLCGLKPLFYPLGDSFGIVPEALKEIQAHPSAVLLLNTPANPTGAVLDESTLLSVLEIARSRNWWIISDEAYEDFVYYGSHTSIGALERDVPPDERRVFTTFSFSKSYGLTGHRLGYVVAPNSSLARSLQIIQEATLVCPSSPIQWGGLAALQTRCCISENRELLKRSWKEALAPLTGTPLLPQLPSGGWYALINLQTDAEDFARDLLKFKGVAITPALGFSAERQRGNLNGPRVVGSGRFTNWARIAFCYRAEIVTEGLNRIRERLDERMTALRLMELVD